MDLMFYLLLAWVTPGLGKLDHSSPGNVFYVGFPLWLAQKLQLMQNAAA